MYTTLFFSLWCALNLVNANNEFLNPPPAGIDVAIDSTVNIQWRCDDCGSLPITLNAWQDKGDGGWAQETLLASVLNPGSYSWTPRTLQGLTIANGFHFEVVFGNESFDSGALFIRDSLSSTSTSSPTTSSTTSTQPSSTLQTSTPTSSTPSQTSSSSTTSQTSTSAPASTNSNANDTETLKVGLGVGLGVGIPFILLVGGIVGYIVFRRRDRRHQDAPYKPATEVKSELPAYEIAKPPQELTGDGWRHELPQ